MAETDLIMLYSERILKLATDIPLTERLSEPDASVRRRSPLCGSTITVDVVVDGERVAAFGQDVNACALGQAAAAVLAANVIGRSRQELVTARDALQSMLSGGEVPDAPFDGFEGLIPARDFENRHASIMLAIEATIEAIDSASAASATG